jgi:Pyridoxamine 5'-phosphate oxidase
MPTRQGDVSLLMDPVAQQLLESRNLARLAYTWTDGSPRVLPIWFHWDGRQIVLGTPPAAPKMKALARNPKVAVTIDTSEFPNKVLLVRGTAGIEVLEIVVPEYALAARRYFGDGAEAWLQQVGTMLSAMGGMARVAITPEWVGILDFEQRFPSALEKAMAATPAH